MHTDLEGKCAIVCAASRGLGKATALALAREGASVAICGRDAAALDAAAADIARAGSGHVLAIPADLSRAEDIDRLIRDSAARLGGIDVLVTNTGGPKSGPFETLSDDDWRGAIDSLLMSVVRLSRACVPHLRARGGRHWSLANPGKRTCARRYPGQLRGARIHTHGPGRGTERGGRGARRHEP